MVKTILPAVDHSNNIIIPWVCCYIVMVVYIYGHNRNRCLFLKNLPTSQREITPDIPEIIRETYHRRNKFVRVVPPWSFRQEAIAYPKVGIFLPQKTTPVDPYASISNVWERMNILGCDIRSQRRFREFPSSGFDNLKFLHLDRDGNPLFVLDYSHWRGSDGWFG